MLVLTRRTGEEVVIGGNIRIVVTEVSGQRVRLGITAPKDIRVDRAEVNARRELSERLPSPPADKR
ncbi:MAG TPA: carbon storage regulator [Pirellulales bacterium]|jgi:carbon storage regulator|nr:carbon storage regulator [Pirellulales bacterium]